MIITYHEETPIAFCRKREAEEAAMRKEVEWHTKTKTNEKA